MAIKRKKSDDDALLKQLNDLIRSCEETARQCVDCTDCGLDMEPETRKNNEQLTIARKLKSKLFPHAT